MKNISLFFILWFMEGVFSETVSVMEGESVTLSPQLEIKKDDVIDWRFGDHLIARVRNNNPSVYWDVLDGKFRDRLQLDGQTGNLTITDIKTTDAGVYELSNSINTFKKAFNVSVRVRGASSGAVTPSGDVTSSRAAKSSGAATVIVSVVVLLVAAAAALIVTG